MLLWNSLTLLDIKVLLRLTLIALGVNKSGLRNADLVRMHMAEATTLAAGCVVVVGALKVVVVVRVVEDFLRTVVAALLLGVAGIWRPGDVVSLSLREYGPKFETIRRPH